MIASPRRWRHKQDQCRHQHEEQQPKNIGDPKWGHDLEDGAGGDVAEHTFEDEDVQADRWRDQADLGDHDHDDAKPDQGNLFCLNTGIGGEQAEIGDQRGEDRDSQGMNAGLRDVFNIAWKIKLALEGVATAQIIETHEEEQKGPVTDMIDYAVALSEIVMPRGELDDGAKEVIKAS